MTATAHNPASPRRKWYVMLIWAERQSDHLPVWRGFLEMTDGKRMYFTTLAELNQLLTTMGGWADPGPAQPHNLAVKN